jgi:hypothetical protein
MEPRVPSKRSFGSSSCYCHRSNITITADPGVIFANDGETTTNQGFLIYEQTNVSIQGLKMNGWLDGIVVIDSSFGTLRDLFFEDYLENPVPYFEACTGSLVYRESCCIGYKWMASFQGLNCNEDRDCDTMSPSLSRTVSPTLMAPTIDRRNDTDTSSAFVKSFSGVVLVPVILYAFA